MAGKFGELGRHASNPNSMLGGLRGENPKDKRLEQHRQAIVRPEDFSPSSGENNGNSINPAALEGGAQR
jgi:hypothetical protein